MGVKSKKKAKTRLDAYYRLAKDQGYRARSAFKLIQLNRKYDFLAKARVCVDLCAAPGGWCQVAAKHMPVGSKIVGVDLVPIPPIRGVKTFVGDITDDKTRKLIVTYLKKEPADCVIHDGAPNVGGVWAKDLYAQNALVVAALKLACGLLKPQGWFVSKVFRSQDFQKLIWLLKQFFAKVEATKPLASRMESAEIFVVCAGYKAPKHIDPAMFNAQKIFSDVGPEKVLTAAGTMIVPKSNVPQGYDEFNTIVHRTATMSEFLSCEDPRAFLGHYHEIRFPDHDKHVLKNKKSKPEYIYLCQDLQQVGDADRRRLIRWREGLLREMRRTLRDDDEENAGAAAKGGEAADDEEEDDDLGGNDDGAEAGGEEDETRHIAKELLELRKRKEKEQKRKQKKVVDRKLRQVRGLINYDPTDAAAHPTELDRPHDDVDSNASDRDAEGAADSDEDEAVGEEGWNFNKLRKLSEADMAKHMDDNFEEPDMNLNPALVPVNDVDLKQDVEFDIGGDEFKERMQLVEGEEGEMDVDNYGNYIARKVSEREAIYDQPEVSEDEDEDDEESEEEYEDQPDRKKGKTESGNQQEDDDNNKNNKAPSKQAKWKSLHKSIDKVLDNTFPKISQRGGKKGKKGGADLEQPLVSMVSAEALAMGGGKKAAGGNRKRGHEDHSESDDSASEISDVGADGYEEGGGTGLVDAREGILNAEGRVKKRIIPDIGKVTAAELVKSQRKQVMEQNKNKRQQRQTQKAGKKKDDGNADFEEIPIAMTDPDIRDRTLAIATKMLDKKSRKEILENAMNRYTYNDDDLPDWFIKDEQRNCKVLLPVTAAEMEAQRERFRELNARPGKKVMEAIGRKRRKAQRMLRQIIEKGKNDPRARTKAQGLSVRKLMRAQAIKGNDKKKQKEKLDPKAKGEKKRDRQKQQRMLRGNKKRGRK